MAPQTCFAPAPSLDEEIEPGAAGFYRQAMQALNRAAIPFLVGGAFAHACHTGIRRPTKDLDLFIRREHYAQIAHVVAQQGWRAELSHPHWLAKVYHGAAFIDLIFNSGNGLTPVDGRWFQHNCRVEVLGVPVAITNPEDCLVTKAFIMERERYDGGDIAHLLQAHAEQIDWPQLLERFGAHWRVLLAHLTLFGYVYPGERHRIPAWVMGRLAAQLAAEAQRPPTAHEGGICAGTLLSREQYLHDVQHMGYQDARLASSGGMTADDVAAWTEAIPAR